MPWRRSPDEPVRHPIGPHYHLQFKFPWARFKVRLSGPWPDCASCHGFHGILPSTDPKSRTNPKNLARTCGACHPRRREPLHDQFDPHPGRHESPVATAVGAVVLHAGDSRNAGVYGGSPRRRFPTQVDPASVPRQERAIAHAAAHHVLLTGCMCWSASNMVC